MSDVWTADEFLALEEPGAPVPFRAGGKRGFCRLLSAGERDAWEASLNDDGKVNPKDLRAKYLVLCLCDESGRPLFRDEHIEALTKKLAKLIDPIFDACMKINGVSKKDVDELGNAGAA